MPQVPLALAYALTIHKAQGQTPQRVRVDLNKTFAEGHCKQASPVAFSTTADSASFCFRLCWAFSSCQP